ncbi:MAG: ABC transporter permease [Bacteroidota bacterium]
MHQDIEEHWDLIILPRNRLFNLQLRELWRYRDLMLLFVKRDFIAQYKQTILGPLWHFINPIFTTVTYTIIFGNIAQLSTDGTPRLVFYMSGITLWNFYSNTTINTGSTFTFNAAIFGKVYFPRLIAPLATVISLMIDLCVHIVTLTGFVIYYQSQGYLGNMQWTNLIYLPFVILLTAGFGLGSGTIISSLTTKYRDLTVFTSLGINLLMFATPVIYPFSSIQGPYKAYFAWNPISPLIEFYRFIFTGTGTFSAASLAYSTCVMGLLLFVGLLMFNRVEKTFMDTV